ncbi:hypothetical protein [Bosea massiliensis]|uniref:Uncharacterized protein n=1 Tax=Bosea massiliensis TaxID=151419 RepID=A0ABW0NWP1_9HYPH
MRTFSIDPAIAAAYLGEGDSATAADRAFYDRQADLRDQIREIEATARSKGVGLDHPNFGPQLAELRQRLDDLRAQQAAGAERREYSIFMATKVRAALPSDRLPLPFIASAL